MKDDPKPPKNPHPSNLFHLSPALQKLKDQEIFESLLERPGLKIERIISHGQITPEGQWYDQDQDEWVALLQGEATLLWEDRRTTELKAGDFLLIPAGCRHRVIHTSTEPPCVWLALFLKARA